MSELAALGKRARGESGAAPMAVDAGAGERPLLDRREFQDMNRGGFGLSLALVVV